MKRAPYSIASHPEMKRLLQIANRHLQYIARTHSQISLSRKQDHAIVATVFSAAAIEAGLNLFISIPVLDISDADTRRFHGRLISKYLRLSIPKKLQFICESSDEIRKDRYLCEKVRQLFNKRNKVIHSSPEYIEPIGLPDIEDQVAYVDQLSEDDLVPRPRLESQGMISTDIEDAFEHFQIATEFLMKLKV
jgi:hypothetical protein